MSDATIPTVIIWAVLAGILVAAIAIGRGGRRD
jgi:hypothetical protein